MKKILSIMYLIALLPWSYASAQQSQEFGEFEIHYSALNSSFLTPEVATAYGIRRSSSRALINISVLKSGEAELPVAVSATVVASGRNLTGQTRNVEMREIDQGDGAIYYIGELSVRNMEMFDFTVLVTPQGTTEPLKVKFRQQFYTE